MSFQGKNSDKLDKIDLRILKELQEDSSISNIDLAHKVGLSATPTFERVKKLEAASIIKSYHAEVDAEHLGLGIQSFMLVSMAKTNGNSVINFDKQIKDIPEIIECYRVTGSADYMLRAMVTDIASYEKLAMEIRNIKEVSNVTTMIILSTIKKSKVVPLEYE